MATARDGVVQSLTQLAAAAQDLTASAAELAAAIAEDPPDAAKIGRAITPYTTRLKATRLAADVVHQALKRWALLNPGLGHEKF